MLAHDFDEEAVIILDSGRDKFRKILQISNCDLPLLQRKALVGFHAFTGCDQVSSFLRKGKVSCWKVLQRYTHLFDGFEQLGTELEPSEQLTNHIEEFVCKLYGEKKVKEVNQARRNIFWRTLKKKKKVIDLSLLPPCRSSLLHHLKRANYVAYSWRQASYAHMLIEPPQWDGWDDDYNFTWSCESYPKSVVDFLASTSSIRCDDEQFDETDDDDDIDLEDINDVFEEQCDNDDDDNPYI